ncbi:MAG: nitroreductase family protein [Microthrixaceae bacterium]
MDVRDAIRARRSVKQLRAPAPSDAEVAELLELAATAPDHGGLSPWRFRVLHGAELTAFPLDAGSSPMVVVVGAEPQGEKIRVEEQLAAVAAAAQLLLLAADAMGYGAMWRTGSAAYDPEVARAAGLGPAGRIVAFIHLGTPADDSSGDPSGAGRPAAGGDHSDAGDLGIGSLRGS